MWMLAPRAARPAPPAARRRSTDTVTCLPPPHPNRGQLSAGQRRVAYDSLGMYQQLAQLGTEALSPDGWAASQRYAQAVSAILAADGVRCVEGGGPRLR